MTALSNRSNNLASLRQKLKNFQEVDPIMFYKMFGFLGEVTGERTIECAIKFALAMHDRSDKFGSNTEAAEALASELTTFREFDSAAFRTKYGFSESITPLSAIACALQLSAKIFS
ncbi:MAG: hypothetical protein NTW50_03470 [Candidatus Berkelbacteria bacterium]|nr:hypothetical protein [Candidatus Berkelbacteria bacterium]